jgi:copper homeostasis protein
MPKVNIRPLIEVAVADLDDAIVAEQCGADRLELNSGMPLGGLTPSIGLVQEVVAAVRIPVVVMVRPRPGGFCYSARQHQTALRDAEAILSAGAAGIVWGALNANRDIDQPKVIDMKSLVDNKELVFHRAIDLARDWRASLEALVDLRVDRILSSGQQSSAIQGVDCLKAMVQAFDRRMELIVGGGVRVATIPMLYAAGLRQFHGTFSQAVDDPGYENARFRFAENDQLRCIDTPELRSARTCLDHLSSE